MRQTYNPPILTEFGRIDEVTLGGSGSHTDAIFDLSDRTLTVDPANPTCTNDVRSGYCYSIVP